LEVRAFFAVHFATVNESKLELSYYTKYPYQKAVVKIMFLLSAFVLQIPTFIILIGCLQYLTNDSHPASPV